jgi:hypothetical protein
MSTSILVASVIRGVLWLIPLALAVWHRRPNTFAVAVLYVAANVAGIFDNRELAGFLAIPAAGGAAWLLCDRILRAPAQIEKRWHADQAYAARERHDLRNQLAVLAAENAILSIKLKDKD